MFKQAAVFLALIILILGAFFGGVRNLSPIFQQCIDQHQYTNAETTAHENPSRLGVVGVHIYCGGMFVEMNSTSITAIATLVIAAFTGVLWWANSQQARLTKEAIIADGRALIFPTGLWPTWESDSVGQYHWRLRPVLKNNGRTPPKNMQMVVMCEIRNAPLPNGYTFSHNPAVVAPGVIPPGSELLGGQAPQIPGAAISPQDINDVQFGRKFVYLWGWIKYRDIYPGTPEHTTNYCWQILVTGDPFTFCPNTPGQPPAPGTLAFHNIHHPEGNSID